jgi:hypothetical protein
VEVVKWGDNKIEGKQNLLKLHGTLTRQISRADQKSEKATGLFCPKIVKIALRTTKIKTPSFSQFLKIWLFR